MSNGFNLEAAPLVPSTGPSIATARERSRYAFIAFLAAFTISIGVLMGRRSLHHSVQDSASSTPWEQLQPPIAAARPHLLKAHNDIRVDDYYWLRDDGRANSHVLAHLEAETAYTRAALADTEELQEALYQEMRGRLLESSGAVPLRYGNYWHYTRSVAGKPYRLHCRRQVPPGAGPPTENDVMDESEPEEIVLDENAEAANHSYYYISSLEASPDGRLLAFEEDTRGDEVNRLRIRDIASGKELLTQTIKGTGGMAWSSDNRTLFYTTMDPTGRFYKVWRHAVGAASQSDALVYEEQDRKFDCSVYLSRSGRVVYIVTGSRDTSEVRFIDAEIPASEWQLVWARSVGVDYSVSDRGDHFFITVRDQARPNSEVLVAPISDPTAANVLLPYREDVEIEFLKVSRDFLASFERRNGLRQAVVYSLPEDGSMPSSLGEGQPIQFDDPTYELRSGSQGDFDSQVLRLAFTSFTVPEKIIDFNMATGTRAVKREQDVSDWFDPSKYTAERLWAAAPDGVRVPMSLLYRKDLARLDGTDPLLLQGYGAYGDSNDAYFSSLRLSLVDRGWTFGIAHIRGGGEMGHTWYDGGRYLDKKNTFTDFIACSEHLVALRYTSPERLCIQGRSAGGLTIGAALNLRPDLFAAAVMTVPFVDILTTMLDETLPRTVLEYEEWGNPQNETYYNYIKSYSPYDNIQRAAYPHILATGGLWDVRVGYWEPAKFVSKLRQLRSNSNMLLLRIEGAGHFSASGRYGQLNQTALEYAFLLKALNILCAQLQPSVEGG